MAVTYLRLRADPGGGETLSFSNELVLGRETLDQSGHTDARLSRRHARVFAKADGQVWVEDVGSTKRDLRQWQACPEGAEGPARR